MREIRFRTWDTETKTMSPNGFSLNTYWRPNQAGYAHSVDKDFRRSNTQILLQCTGLRDKHGVEIYESDVLQWGVRRAAVKCINACWSFDGMGLHPCNQTAEVIGNVFENPELISAKATE